MKSSVIKFIGSSIIIAIWIGQIHKIYMLKPKEKLKRKRKKIKIYLEYYNKEIYGSLQKCKFMEISIFHENSMCVLEL